MELASTIRECLSEDNPEALFADGFDDAIIGTARQMNSPTLVVYSVKRCIEILSKQMDYESAVEYFDFNVRGAYYGEHTPIFLDDDY